MGYRSDVLIAIEFKDKDHFNEYKTKLLLLEPEILNTITNNFKVYESNNVIIEYMDDCIKWYESYPKVRAIETVYSYFEDMAEEDDNLYGVYIRIGEEQGDIDYEYFNTGYTLAKPEVSIYRDYA